MRIAIVLDNVYLAESNRNIKLIVLFDIVDDLVVAVDKDILSMTDINYLCLWLLAKKVVKLYCDGINETGKNFLEKAGIEVYPLDNIRDHPLLQALMLNDKEENS